MRELLKQTLPNQTFAVFLATDGGCEPTGMLTTNNQGTGNSHIDSNKSDITVPGTAGTYYVVLQASRTRSATRAARCF